MSADVSAFGGPGCTCTAECQPGGPCTWTVTPLCPQHDNEDEWWEKHAEGSGPGPADCAWGEPFRCRRHCPEPEEETPPGCQPQDCCGDPGAHWDAPDARPGTTDHTLTKEPAMCTRRAPHLCRVNGPCNGLPKGGTLPPARTHHNDARQCPTWGGVAVPGGVSYECRCKPGHTTEKEKHGGVLATGIRRIKRWLHGGPYYLD